MQAACCTDLRAGSAVVMLNTKCGYTKSPYTMTVNLVNLDLSNPAALQVAVEPVFTGDTTTYYTAGSFTPVADPMDPSGFYLANRTRVGEVTRDGYSFTQYKYYAQKRQLTGAKSVARETINLPGPLVNTWAGAHGHRMFLTRAPYYLRIPQSNGRYAYQYEIRPALLRQVGADGGSPVAELLDGRVISGFSLSALVREGNSMVVTGQPYYSSYSTTSSPTWEQTSDHLMMLDLSANRLDVAYDQPTKAYYLRIMGTQKGRGFLNLQGDGIVVIDIAKPTAPKPIRFLRALDYATHRESFGDDIYVASGYFGAEHMSLTDPTVFLTATP